MRGLMIKDFCCLRKSRKTFILVAAGVILMAVLFVLSCRFGNLAAARTRIGLEDPALAELMEQAAQIVICFLLLLPIAFLGSLAECFKEDARVGFWKPLSALPLSPWEVVGSRFLTCLLFAAVSMGVSALAALCVSSVEEQYRLEKLLVLILTFGACFLIYMSLCMFLIYLLGARRADLIQILPLGLLYLGIGCSLLMRLQEMSEEEMLQFGRQLGPRLWEMLERGYGLLLLLAAGCMVLAYLGSVAVVKQRKGVW